MTIAESAAAPGESSLAASDRLPAVAALDVLRELAAALSREDLVREIADVSSRLGEGRFFVAVLGQFKRGKSSLVNALIGRAILPVGIPPVTSVVTIVRHGAADGALVHLRGVAEPRPIALGELVEYVGEQSNPGNAKGVVAAEARIASALLESGLCLVDTPGLGSVFAANTAETRAFLPQIDAVLLCSGVDPPLSADELDVLLELAPGVPTIFVVIGKADRATPAELAEARAFTERIVAERLGRPATKVFAVSALERTRDGVATRDWAALVAALQGLSARDVIRSAVQRGARRFTQRLRHEIGERRDALTRPLEASARRLEALGAASARAEQSRADLRHLLAAEERTIRARFVADLTAGLQRIRPEAHVRLERALAVSADGGSRSHRLASGYDVVQRLASEAILGWRGPAQDEALRLYRLAVRRFVEHTNATLAEVLALSGRSPADATAQLLDAEQELRAPSGLYFTDLLPHTTRSPLVWLADSLLPASVFERRLRARASAYLDLLLETNAHRLVNDLIEQVRESRAALERELGHLLDESVGTAQRALERAAAARAAGEQEVRREIEELDRCLERLRAMEPDAI
jgi:predicted GTPase